MVETWEWATQTPARYLTENIPPDGGCYAIYADGKLLYIGSTSCLVDRLRQWSWKGISQLDGRWMTPWGDYFYLRIKVRRCNFYGDWATRELRLLRRLRPPGNTRSIEVKDHVGR